MPIETKRTVVEGRSDVIIARLVSEAARLITKNGYGNTSNRAVGRLCGVTDPVINYHFGGKQGLAIAVVNKASSIYERAFRFRIADEESQNARICALLDCEKSLYDDPFVRASYKLTFESGDTEIGARARGSFQRKREIYREIVGNESTADMLFGYVLGATAEGRVVGGFEGQRQFGVLIDDLKEQFGEE